MHIFFSERKPYFAHEIYLKCIIRTKNVEFLKPLSLLQNHKTIPLQCLQGLKNDYHELLNSFFREDNFVHLVAKNKLKIKFLVMFLIRSKNYNACR